MRKKCWIFDKVHLFRASIFFRSFIDYLRLKIETWSNCVKRNKYLLNKKTVAIVVVDSCRCVILTRITWKTSEKTNTSIALFMENVVRLGYFGSYKAQFCLTNVNCIQFKWHTVPHWFSRILMKCALLIRIDSGRPANFLCFSFCSALQIHDFTMNAYWMNRWIITELFL